MAHGDKTPASAIERYNQFQESAKKELELVRIELARQMQAAADTYKLLRTAGLSDIWTDPQYGQSIGELDLYTSVVEPKKKTTRKPRVEMTDEDIISYIGEEPKKQGDITEHFKTTTVTMVKRLKKLADSKKLKSTKSGAAVLWSKK